MSAETWEAKFSERVRNLSPQKGSVEQRVLDYIRAHPVEVSSAAASTIGKVTRTSGASVIRTVQKLGYGGLKEFREDLKTFLGIEDRPPSATQEDTKRSTPRKMSVRALYAEIREMILLGSLNPEGNVTESQLANMFGVSRTPVREAVRMLEQGGIVVRDHRGITTPKQTPRLINEMYDAHILLHSALARRAAERRTDADLHLMRLRNQVMRDIPVEQAGSVEAKLANGRFHESIYDAARDRILGLLIRQLTDRLDVWSGTTLDAPGRWAESLDEHDAMVDTIARWDGEAAAEVAEKHLETARRIRLCVI